MQLEYRPRRDSNFDADFSKSNLPNIVAELSRNADPLEGRVVVVPMRLLQTASCASLLHSARANASKVESPHPQESAMRKLIVMAVLGFVWKKYASRKAAQTATSGATQPGTSGY